MVLMRYCIFVGVVVALTSHPLMAQVNMLPGSNMFRSDYAGTTKNSQGGDSTSNGNTANSTQNSNSQQTQAPTPQQKQDADWDELKKRESEVMKENADKAEFRARYTMRDEDDHRFVEVNQHGSSSLKPVDALTNRLRDLISFHPFLFRKPIMTISSSGAESPIFPAKRMRSRPSNPLFSSFEEILQRINSSWLAATRLVLYSSSIIRRKIL